MSATMIETPSVTDPEMGIHDTELTFRDAELDAKLLSFARQMAADESTQADHWLDLHNITYQNRVRLYAAAAFICSCLHNNSYRSAVFLRHAAEELKQQAHA